MEVLPGLEGLEWSALHLWRDRPTGLRAVVAVHDRSLGPVKGGTRLRSYPSLAAAARDAVRLARGMTYKFAVHGLPYGGGKAVIVQDAAGAADRALLERRLLAYGELLEGLGGHFETGPDYGVGPAEVAVIQRATRHVAGAGLHADASAATAAGVRVCLERALRQATGGDLAGRRVAVQGVGAVGGALARQLAARGAALVLADADAARVEALAQDLGAEVAEGAAIATADVDAFAPCAVGDVLTPEAIGGLRCRVVAGAANDQLAPPELATARALAARGVLYVPDFVANGGGAVALTASADERGPGGARDAALAEERVGATYDAVAARAEREGTTLYEAAVALAEDRLAAARAAAGGA